MKKLIIILVLVAAAQAATIFFGLNQSENSKCDVDEAQVEKNGLDPSCTPFSGFSDLFSSDQDKLTFTPSTVNVTQKSSKSTKYTEGNTDGVNAKVELTSGYGASFSYNCPDCKPPGLRTLCLCNPKASLKKGDFSDCENEPLNTNGTCRVSSLGVVLQETSGTIVFKGLGSKSTSLVLK